MVAEAAAQAGARNWLRAKLRVLAPRYRAAARHELMRAVAHGAPEDEAPPFANPFAVADLAVFDDETLRDLLAGGAFGLSPRALGRGLRGADPALIARFAAALPEERWAEFRAALDEPRAPDDAEAALRRVLDAFFWELTYWKTPELYEELTVGEWLHPGIFRRLGPDLRGRVVLDAGAGSGRATLACLERGAARVYAVEPSPGLRRILRRKLEQRGAEGRAPVLAGRFDALPLEAESVDVALSCSAFTADPEQGGEAGLAELRRVMRPGGKIVLIWPRPQDYGWLAAHGFRYIALPVPPGLSVHFRSLPSARRIARRFYARNRDLLRYLRHCRRPEVPYAVLGANPPHDYCWLRVGQEG